MSARMSGPETHSWERLLRLWREGALMELVSRCRRHLQRWHELPGPFLLLGDSLGKMARYQEAERYFREAERRCQQEQPLAYELRGDLHRRAHRFRRAEDCYGEALRLDTRKVNPWIGLAQCRFDLGDLESAALTLREAQERALGAEPEYELGRVCRGQLRFTEAAECFRRCLKLDPSHPSAQSALDDVQNALEPVPGLKRGDLDSYLAVSEPAHMFVRLRACVDARPQSYGLFLDLARLEIRLRRYRDARESCRKAAQVANSTNRDLYLRILGDLYRKQGHWRWANHYYAKCCEANSTNADGHIYRGAAYARQGRLGQAEACHRLATQCTVGCIDEAYLNLGLALRGQERLDEATAALEEALRLSPDYDEARLTLEDVKRAQQCGE